MVLHPVQQLLLPQAVRQEPLRVRQAVQQAGRQGLGLQVAQAGHRRWKSPKWKG